MGLLSRTDQDALRVYCEAWESYVECETFLQNNGLTYLAPNGYQTFYPQRDEKYKSLEIVRRYQLEFGLTPAARSRIGIQQKKVSDAWGDFFKDS